MVKLDLKIIPRILQAKITMKFSLALVLLSYACSSSASEPAWSSKSLDPFKFSTLTEFHVPKNVADLFSIINSQPEKAHSGFAKLYAENDNDSYILYGFLLASNKCGKSLDALETVASHYADFRQKELKNGIRASRIPPAYTIGYSLGMTFLQGNGVDIPAISPDRYGKNSRYYYSTLKDAVLDVKQLDRAQVILLGGSYYLLGSVPQNRQLLQAYSNSHPKDVVIHLMLCSAYGTGTYKLFDMHGKEKPIPDAERTRDDLAKREALAAWKLAPRSPIANYYAGYYSQADNPDFTKKCWKIYLDSPYGKRANKVVEYVTKWVKSY